MISRSTIKSFSLSLLIVSSLTSTLVTLSEVASAQIRPMPGTPGGGGGGPRPQPSPPPFQPGPPERPMPRPMPEPTPYPRPNPQPYPQPQPYPRPYPQPAPYPQPDPRPIPYPGPGQVRSSIRVPQITRQVGGEWKQIILSPSVRLSDIELTPIFANLLVHEFQVVDSYGATVPVNELNETMIDSNRSIHSFDLDYLGPISAINMRVESYGGYADLEVMTVSDQFTQLFLRNIYPFPEYYQ